MKLYQGYCTNNDFDSHIELMNWNSGLVLALNESIIFMIILCFIIEYVYQKFYRRQKILQKAFGSLDKLS